MGKKILLNLILFFIISTPTARATQLNITLNQGYYDDLGNTLSTSLQLAFILASLIAFFFLIFAGLKWITSGGDSKKIEEARNQILASIVGLLILASSWAIINFTLLLLGIDGGVQALLKKIPTFAQAQTSTNQNNNYHHILNTSTNSNFSFIPTLYISGLTSLLIKIHSIKI